MSYFKPIFKLPYPRVGIILSCFILSSLLLNCKIFSKKEHEDEKKTENLCSYVFNNSFEIKIPNYLKLDSDIGNFKLVKHDKTNNTYYYKIEDEDRFITFTNDTIDAKIIIFLGDMSDASNEFKKDSHHSNKFASLAFNKKIFENRFDDIDDVENYLNYQYMDVGKSKAFHINYDEKVGLATYQINHIYELWNYDERVHISLDYYSNINKNIKDECESIIDNFKWINPK
ncbi:MAG: hypothetical protein IKX31_03950 [Muribaculaceae bacterium]|nr:hypothetical protein [Muribaculaceae bacterium]